MKTRRELLTMSGAGVAALALPSFPPARGVALAQNRRADPMLVEIGAQFQRALARLSAVPPRGNAQQLASLYRMLAAWGRVNNIDAQIRQAVGQAIALEGHYAFVTKLGSFDWLGDAKARGYKPPFQLQNPTAVDFAKAVGLIKRGSASRITGGASPGGSRGTRSGSTARWRSATGSTPMPMRGFA